MTKQSSPKSRPLRHLAWFSLLVASLLMVLGNSKGLKAKPVTETVTIAFTSLPFAALAQVAQAEGYFQKEGLQVIPLNFTHGKVALQAMLEGKADVATVAETPLVLAVMGGAKLSILATIHSSCRSHCIVARRDRGVLAPHDLKGKRIATSLGTSAHFFVDLFLLSNGIPAAAVELVDLKPEAMLDALEQGKVDALAGFDPYVTVASNKLGARGVAFHDENIYRETFNVVGGRRFVEGNPEKVRKILRALVRAERFVADNPEKAQSHVAHFCGSDQAVIRSAWRGGNFRVTLDQSLVLALEDESRWAVRRGFASGAIPNYLEYIHLPGLDSIKPQAIRILR